MTEIESIATPCESTSNPSSEPLSALCLEAAGKLDDGQLVNGVSELLRAVAVILMRAGA